MEQKNRALVLGAVSLTINRPHRSSIEVLTELKSEFDELMLENKYLDSAPFDYINLIIRYGLKNDELPIYQRINKKYSELPISIEIDVREMNMLDRDELKLFLGSAIKRSLLEVGRKYDLAWDELPL